MKTSEITGEYIKLDQWLKKEDLVSSGGEAHQLIQEGKILFNGAPVHELRKKLRDQDRVTVEGEEWQIRRVDL